MAQIWPLQFNKLIFSSPSLLSLLSASTATRSSPTNLNLLVSTSRNKKTTHSQQQVLSPSKSKSRNECRSTRIWSRRNYDEDEEEEGSFEEAVELFNGREYYKCHDLLEPIWNHSQEPIRTLIHAILQCAVAFHHLFNQNHKGAMMELGEGLCKLRKMNFYSGPFYQFEKEISAVLDFIYQTQLELAACTDDFCVTLDQSERSYKLLGGYAAGQLVYSLESDANDCLYIVFCPKISTAITERPRVRLPVLNASEEHLLEYKYD